jgi:hypothetical protein
MKVSTAKKCKFTHLTVNQKFKSPFKNKRKQNAKRKFCLLTSERSESLEIPSLVVKFTGRNVCRAMWAVAVSKSTRKIIKKKSVIRWDRDKKTLKNVEVVVPKKFKEKYLRAWMRLAASVSREEIKREKHDPVEEETKTIECKKSEFSPVMVKVSLVNKSGNKVEVTSIRKDTEVPSINPKPSPIKLFDCKICNYKFTSRKLFDEHRHEQDADTDSDEEKEMVIDDDVELVLNNSFGDEDTNESHLRLEEEEDQVLFCCMVDECGKIFEEENKLKEHIAIDHKPKKFTCHHCNVVFAKEVQFKAHMRIAHAYNGNPKPHFFTMSPPPSTSAGPSTSSTSTSVMKFMRYDSKPSKVFICSLCSAKFQDRSTLDRHVVVHHITKIYFCYKCHGAYAKTNLLNHLKNAHMSSVNDVGYIQTIADTENVASHRCAFCSFTSKNRPRVRDHMNDEHYDLYDKDDLKETNEDEENHSSSPDSLENIFTMEPAVISAPLEDDPEDLLVACPIRKRRRPNDPSFKFRCVRCQRRFSRPSNLRDHVCTEKLVVKVTPEPEKPWTDPWPKRMSTKEQLMNGFYNCKSCPQVFTDKSMFNFHVAQNHSESTTSSTSGFYSGYSS